MAVKFSNFRQIEMEAQDLHLTLTVEKGGAHLKIERPASGISIATIFTLKDVSLSGKALRDFLQQTAAAVEEAWIYDQKRV